MSESGKKRILVVDDEPDIVVIEQVALEEAGYEVSSANNGEECLKMVAASPPDLIVLDVQMPGKPGFFVLQQLRENLETRAIPVIMVTGVGERLGISFSKKDMYDYLGHEPEVYLEKPVRPEALQQAAAKLLGS